MLMRHPVTGPRHAKPATPGAHRRPDTPADAAAGLNLQRSLRAFVDGQEDPDLRVETDGALPRPYLDAPSSAGPAELPRPHWDDVPLYGGPTDETLVLVEVDGRLVQATAYTARRMAGAR